jgi:SOS response regulatory protein OraA/RecX
MDQTQDLSGRNFYRLTKLCPPPDFVKKASVQDLCGEEIQPEAYGDPRRRLFPCHSAAATWASLAFLLDKRADFRKDDAEMIEERIMRCGSIHGITKSLNQLKEDFVKAASVPTTEDFPDDVFAVVIEQEGQKIRRYPMRNAAEVKTAADYLLQYRDRMRFELRQAIADKIMQKQAQFGVPLGADTHEYIEKQAGYGACAAKEAVELIYNRVQATKTNDKLNDLQVEMLKMAKHIGEHPSQFREPGMRIKVASIIDQFDREHKLNEQYGPDLPRIEDVIFGLTGSKMAAVVGEHISTTTGNMYKMADLERLKLGEVRDYFGDEMANAFTSDGVHIDSEKAARIIPTLPRGDMTELDRLMESMGIRPMAKEASAQAVKISDNYLKDLAFARKKAMFTH